MNDSQLVRAARKGDNEAFGTLYLKHSPRLIYMFRYKFGRINDAEDLVQDGFALAYANLKGFKGKSQFSTWVYRICFNAFLMSMRKKVHQTVSLDSPVHFHTSHDEGDVKQFQGIPHRDRNLEGAIDREFLADCVSKLPPCQRTIFVLHHFEGYAHSEIAKIVGCTIGNSKSQFHRAKDRLREFYAGRKLKFKRQTYTGHFQAKKKPPQIMDIRTIPVNPYPSPLSEIASHF